MFIYKAARHHAPIEDEYATLEEAIQRARTDRSRGEAYPKEITDESGKPVLDHDQLWAVLDAPF